MYLKHFKMLGYIISDKEKINVEEHEIKSFDILHKTNLNIFVVENNKVLYKNNIIYEACCYGNVQVLEWFKNSGYQFKYNKKAIYWASFNRKSYVLKFYSNVNIKKLIKWASNNFIKTIKFKTHNKYLKGYQKN